MLSLVILPKFPGHQTTHTLQSIDRLSATNINNETRFPTLAPILREALEQTSLCFADFIEPLVLSSFDIPLKHKTHAYRDHSFRSLEITVLRRSCVCLSQNCHSLTFFNYYHWYYLLILLTIIEIYPEVSQLEFAEVT